eukprot:Gb_14594 [translate_table: standard]
MDSPDADRTPWMVFFYYLFGSVSLLTLIFNVWFITIKKKKEARLPPGPRGWPIVGNLFQLGKKPNASLAALARKYGPLMTLHLGMQTMVVVSSPGMAKEFLTKNDNIFSGRTTKHVVESHSFNQSSISWRQSGPRWRLLRRICNNELFSAKRMEALQHLRRDQVFGTMQLIHDHYYAKGKSVDIGQTIFIASFNLLGNMIFSQNVLNPHSEAADEFKETVWKLMEIAGTPNVADIFPFLQFLDPQGLRREAEICMEKVYAVFEKFIETRLASRSQESCAPDSNSNSNDFLDILLEFRGDGKGEVAQFSHLDIKGLLFDMFLAGSETTSSTIEWAMAEMIRKPQTMKRLQAELDGVVGRHRRVEESDIQNLPYLHAVMTEALRLHPAVPLLLPHTSDKECEVGGYLIPQKSQLLVNVWAIGRDPAIWREPLEFLPDRFLETCGEMDYKGHNFDLIPFGAGRRICVGLPLANRMLHLMIASLLHSFDWCLPDGQKSDDMDMSEKLGITLQKAVPLTAIPTPRLPSHIL